MMKTIRLICLALVVLLLTSETIAQNTTSPASERNAHRVDACSVLGRDDLTAAPREYKKLKRAQIQRRLARQVTRDARQPGLQAMLACLMRRLPE